MASKGKGAEGAMHGGAGGVGTEVHYSTIALITITLNTIRVLIAMVESSRRKARD